MNKQEIEKLITEYETAKKQLNDLIQVQEAYKLDLLFFFSIYFFLLYFINYCFLGTGIPKQ